MYDQNYCAVAINTNEIVETTLMRSMNGSTQVTVVIMTKAVTEPPVMDPSKDNQDG